MLDDLLGRTELKARIQELEDERDSLAARLEAEQARRADAVTDRQAAEERINRLEDRIADLEGRMEDGEPTTEPSFRVEATLRGRRLESVLARLGSFEGDAESVLTAFVDDDVPEDVTELLGSRRTLVDRASPCYVVADDACLLAVALRPPVTPEPFVEWGTTARIDRERLLPTGRFALALVRADTFALGIYEGDERVAFEGFESGVKADHSKGGFSQGRFERIRDGQIADHVRKCVAAIGDPPEAFDRLYVVGDRRLVGEVAGEVDADATAAVDATGKPEPALGDAFADFWTVRLYGL